MRLINELFSNPSFLVDEESLGYIVRDIINMNWWNTSGVLAGYRKNKRVSNPFTEDQKRIAVQLKEFYRHRILETRNLDAYRSELDGYIKGDVSALRQLGAWSMPCRANPSQYFTKDGQMTWVDCTSRATYAAKYVFQNGYIDFDGVCRADGMTKFLNWIADGTLCDLGVAHLFDDGDNKVKAEIFSQKATQTTVAEWVDGLGIKVIPEREGLLEAIGHVRTDPYKLFEAECVKAGTAEGVNECLYGLKTMASVGGEIKRASRASHASDASNASRASDASNASRASDASYASRASAASYASEASYASQASHASAASDASEASYASQASHASDAGVTGFNGSAWSECESAITKPDGLEYPKEFRKNIFAMAGYWKINKEIVALAKLGWFDPFMGHGSSPLYAAKHGVRYLGFDTNKRAFDEYLSEVKDACRRASLITGIDVEMCLQDSTEYQPALNNSFDLCYTSPPYFNFEEYGGNTAHYEGCNNYDDFHQKVSVPVLRNVHKYLTDDGILALQLSTNKSEMNGWQRIAESCGWELVSSGKTGCEAIKYSQMSKRSQGLLVFKKQTPRN